MQWSILDCTLRDGGYYTNWDFQKTLVENYLKTMSDSPISYVEIGYRNSAQTGYAGEYYYLPISTLKRCHSYGVPASKLALMLDAKNCIPEKVPELLGDCRGLVQLVRMAVDPAKLEDGIALAKAVKNLGFEVGLNLMYLSRFGDDYSGLLKFQELGEAIDYLYLVDSYGSCFPQQVKEAIQFAKTHLPQKIGFHGHDNINLAFANALAAIEGGADILDSTVLGMGRGAGNLRTEMIIAYLSKSIGKQIDLSSLADLLETFQVMKDHHRWGSEFPYIISGFADLPQKDVMEWLGKKRYSTGTIVQALQENTQKTSHSESYPKLSDRIQQLGLENIKTCVIIGGGQTAAQHSEPITEYVEKHQGLVIHSSLRNAEFYTNTNPRQILCLPGREAEKLKGLPSSNLKQEFLAYTLSSGCYITSPVPSDITARTVEVEPVTQIPENSQTAVLQQDSPLGIALSIVKTLGIKTVYLAGFDGYPGGNELQKELAREVQDLLNLFTKSHPEIQIESLTPTRYSIPQKSVYALLRA